MNLLSHPTRSALENLLPEAYVAGGSFDESLPHPDEIPSQERLSLLQSTRSEAVTATVDDLLCSTGVEERAPLKKTSEGDRIWPNGYTGSVAHKGAVVLGVLIREDDCRSIGIDVELNQKGGKGLLHTAREGETPPNTGRELSLLAAFSTKEAVYKAYYPVKREVIDFDDVHLVWDRSSNDIDEGVAECPGSVEVDVQCAYQGSWIVSAAQFTTER
ncbi:4'-phosphopantetheinyl transferase superfamily protein [Natrinema sp. H-ect4]|uniref:4'-phosphopantetheinyl transferase superfamily protein n=1 Tax=Natrinema sp. H-ect4 TaxID=3242699 RepID=UPI0035A8AE96